MLEVGAIDRGPLLVQALSTLVGPFFGVHGGSESGVRRPSIVAKHWMDVRGIHLAPVKPQALDIHPVILRLLRWLVQGLTQQSEI